MRYNEAVKEEARSLYLQGLGYKNVAEKLREQYEVPVVHSTVRAWAIKDDWNKHKDKQKKIIQTQTNKTTTRSVIKHIQTLQAIQTKFMNNLKNNNYEVRPHEMVNTIRLLLELEHAKEVKDSLIKEIADKMPIAMKKAGIPKKQINQAIKIWIETVE